MTPPAPSLFSTTTGCPIASWIFGATSRAEESVTPPGAYGTTIRTGLTGHVCEKTEKERDRRKRKAALRNFALLARTVVGRQQLVHYAVEVLPRRFPVRMVADDERRAGVELFVLHVASGEFGPDELPCELEELHAIEGGALRRLEERGELLREPGVLHHRDVGRHLEHAASAKLPELVHEAGIVLRAPFQRRVHHAAVVAGIALGPALVGFDLPVHHAGDHAFHGGHVPQHLANGRHLGGAGGLRDLAAQPEQKPHLRPVAHVGLVIAEAVARGRHVDVAREQRIIVHEDPLPWHLHLLAHHHAVAFVVAP